MNTFHVLNTSYLVVLNSISYYLYFIIEPSISVSISALTYASMDVCGWVCGPLWLPTDTQILELSSTWLEQTTLLGCSPCLASDQKNHKAYEKRFELQNMGKRANPHEDNRDTAA